MKHSILFIMCSGYGLNIASFKKEKIGNAFATRTLDRDCICILLRLSTQGETEMLL